tara:strand:- start:7 stop:384 length:378 start_codon:yes stop_codon:yes gene_type:complete
MSEHLFLGDTTYPHVPAFNLVDSLKQQIEKLTRDVQAREDAAKSALKNANVMKEYAAKFLDIGQLQKDRIAQLERKLDIHEAREQWIHDNSKTEGGGHGFTASFFVPVDHEDIFCGIDAAIKEQK